MSYYYIHIFIFPILPYANFLIYMTVPLGDVLSQHIDVRSRCEQYLLCAGMRIRMRACFSKDAAHIALVV